jgi:hypothetical protein
MKPMGEPEARGRRLFACALGAIALALLANSSVLGAEPSARIEAPDPQWSPAVAAGPENSLGVWMDTRLGESISGTRVSPLGVVLDPQQIWISTAPGAQDWPDVAFGGQNYLAAWQDERVSGSREIYASRVNASGEVLDPGGIPVSTGGCCRFTPAVAYGQDYLVVWAHPGATTSIRGTRIDSAGTVLDPAGIPIAGGSQWHWEPAVASNGSDFLVVWKEDDLATGEIDAARVTADGTVLDETGIHVSAAGSVNYPAVAWDGENYFVVWEDARAGNNDIYGARVTPGGVVLDPDGVPIATGELSQTTPSVAFDGVNFMVAWADDHGRLARVSPRR